MTALVDNTNSTKNIIQVGFEGMPGAGKTSTLVSFAREIGNGCLCLPEINIEEQSSAHQKDDIWKIYHNLWCERLNILKKAKEDLVVFMDRTYFTNLAFTYAFHDRENSEEYKIQKKMISQDFKAHPFDIIFFLDIAPDVGLQRRNRQGDFPNYPWCDITFLERLREFYYKELPKLYLGKIVYLSTDQVDQEELFKKIYSELDERYKGRLTRSKVKHNNTTEEALMLDYASKQKNLGPPYDHGFYVRGYPTIFFRQFALQLEDENIAVLNNNRLVQILGDKYE